VKKTINGQKFSLKTIVKGILIQAIIKFLPDLDPSFEKRESIDTHSLIAEGENS